MPWWVVILIVAFAVVEPAVIIAVVVRTGWNGFAGRHPPAETAPDAVRKSFQSIRVGLMNLGASVHLAVDEKHLHIVPARYLRLFGAQPASVPWERMEVEKSGRRWVTVRIGADRLMGPAWALSLADPGEAEQSGEGRSAEGGAA